MPAFSHRTTWLGGLGRLLGENKAGSVVSVSVCPVASVLVLKGLHRLAPTLVSAQRRCTRHPWRGSICARATQQQLLALEAPSPLHCPLQLRLHRRSIRSHPESIGPDSSARQYDHLRITTERHLCIAYTTDPSSTVKHDASGVINMGPEPAGYYTGSAADYADRQVPLRPLGEPVLHQGMYLRSLVRMLRVQQLASSLTDKSCRELHTNRRVTWQLHQRQIPPSESPASYLLCTS